MKQRMSEYQNSKYVIPKGGSKPPSGDIDYEFDPFYKQRTPQNNQSTLQYHQQTTRQIMAPAPQPLPIQYPQQSNIDQSSHHNTSHHNSSHHNSSHHNSSNHNTSHHNTSHHNTAHHNTSHRVQQQSSYQQPSYQQTTKVISYSTNDTDVGKPIMPQITYYKTPPSNNGNNNPQVQQHQSNNSMYQTQLLEEQKRIQMLEEELNIMRRKVSIQDKLIKKINRNT